MAKNFHPTIGDAAPIKRPLDTYYTNVSGLCEPSGESSCFQTTHELQGPGMYILSMVSLLVFSCGLFGNIMVLYVVGYRKKKRKSGDFYILALACADILRWVYTLKSRKM